jgi:hypothetical protein
LLGTGRETPRCHPEPVDGVESGKPVPPTNIYLSVNTAHAGGLALLIEI